MKRSKRFEELEKRAVNRDSYFIEWPEAGLSAINSPYDPRPSIRVENGMIVEMDGKSRAEFNSLELFISDYGINIKLAEETMEIPSQEIARMIVDINVSRETVVNVTTSITPAKMLEVVKCFNAVEIMMGQMKMRKRKTPSNQAIVTNISDNPVLLAADAAEAALRGFTEIETTCAVSRYAPFNAIAVMIGGLSAKAGVLTQCSMEEALEMKMGMRGLTSYAETISLFGTEKAMDDGNDTIWSIGFLSSIYASRGIKMRCTSGTGSEVLLGHANKKSMLYLEILCVFMAKSCGIQGAQNGSISCIGITTAVPEGFLAIGAENLVVSLLDMEVASGNDQTFSHSDVRRTAKLLMQMLPGTDFITSGYSAVPNFDDVFAGSNTDCDDYDDYYMMQRDMQVDGGINPITEEEAIRVRNRAAKACQAVFKGLTLPPVTDEEVDAATYAYSNEEMPKRNITLDLNAAKNFLEREYTVIDIVQALQAGGFPDIANRILAMLKERVCGDYLQVSAIFDEEQKIRSGLNDGNDYLGPGTGYRLEGDRWAKLKQKKSAIVPGEILNTQKELESAHQLERIVKAGTAEEGEADVVIGISPAFFDHRIEADICRLHHDILNYVMDGIEGYGLTAQVIKVYHTADLAEIACLSAALSKSRVGISLQIKGRAYIRNMREEADKGIEGFFNITLSSPIRYRMVGKTAAALAKGETPDAIDSGTPEGLSNYQLKMIRLNIDERQFIRKNKNPERILLTGDE